MGRSDAKSKSSRDDGSRSKRSRSKDRKDRSPKDRRDRSRSPKDKKRRSRSKDRKNRSRSPKSRKDRSKTDKDRRNRSRSKDRRDRSRSPDRKKSNKERRHKRSRSRSPRDRKDRDRKNRSGSPDRKRSKEEVVAKPAATPKYLDLITLDKEEMVSQLEAEMQGRRERIEKWRAEQKKKGLQEKKADSKAKDSAEETKKSWTLDEEDTDDEAAEDADKKKEEEEDEVDPLDAYMSGIQETVKKINRGGKKGATNITTVVKKPVIITGVATKASKNKGELMEQNMDGLEYSSEEETEDIKTTLANASAGKVRKELPKVDHIGMDYPVIRKDFYVEVAEIANMTEEEVNAYRESLENIKVKGLNVPRPIKSWPQCGVSKKTLDILKVSNYKAPTPVQAQAIPAILRGRDCIAIAKTGSGKTLAFLLPMLRHVTDQLPMWEEGETNSNRPTTLGPIALIMTPTRELAMQIGRECKKFCRKKMRVCVVYGGTSISEQIAELKRGAEIIVCTPGRMIDMLAANSGRVTNLARLSYIVLDEADRMFDLGFEPQVTRVLESVQPLRQIVLFSATFPRQVETLARKILRQPIEIMVGGRSVVCSDVTQEVSILENDDQKFLKLLELLGQFYEKGQSIIFVDKQEAADMLYKDLLTHSYHSVSLHGGIDQVDRDTCMMNFRKGSVPILVATSVAARGLDVPKVVLVVNYDAPNHYEDYVHRCGRTGRAGNKGVAYTFLTPDEVRLAGNIIRAMEASLCKVPQTLHDLWNDYKAKMAAEGKKVKSGGGFSGKGFKFDAEEANLVMENRKFQKNALGLVDSDDEDIDEDLDEHIMKVLNTRRTVKEVSKNAPMITPTVTTTTSAMPAVAGSATAQKLELAKQLAMKFNAQHVAQSAQNLQSQKAAEFVLRGSANPTSTTPSIPSAFCAKTIAEQYAQRLNNRLNYTPALPEDDEDSNNKDAEEASDTYQKYEEELEINDFPQVARWRVTSKEALAQISEYSEAGITVRGTFCQHNKEPPEGERKLFLAIESTDERAVTKAKAEIIRLLREELFKLRNSTGGLKSSGRYKVL